MPSCFRLPAEPRVVAQQTDRFVACEIEARISDKAVGGEILVSSLVREQMVHPVQWNGDTSAADR